MDVFPAKDTPTGTTLDARIGGSPLNVAIGLARLAQPVAFLGSISVDALGERVMRALREEGVSIEAVARTDASTTLGIVGLDSAGTPSYSFYGTSDRQLTREALPLIPDGTEVLHFGSYAMVVEPAASTLHALIESEHRRKLISYDPNIRLGVEPSLPHWTKVLQWMLPRTHLLKISEEDLSLLYPGVDMESLASSWLSKGVRLLVVTRGAATAIAWTRYTRMEVPSVPTTAIDTVGAGDSFQAALLAWLAENGIVTPEALASLGRTQAMEALHFAMQAASITCSRKGADLPRRGELPALRIPA